MLKQIKIDKNKLLDIFKNDNKGKNKINKKGGFLLI